MPYKNIKEREIYQEEYRHSFQGHAIRMWCALRLRTKLKNYEDICDREAFLHKVLNSSRYCTLYNEWKILEFEYKLAPTTDRLNSDIGYLISNIQFITHSENSIKQNALTAKKVIRAGVLYSSISDLARNLGLRASTISRHLKKGSKIKGELVNFVNG